jgi:hypothetical protein
MAGSGRSRYMQSTMEGGLRGHRWNHWGNAGTWSFLEPVRVGARREKMMEEKRYEREGEGSPSSLALSGEWEEHGCPLLRAGGVRQKGWFVHV